MSMGLCQLLSFFLFMHRAINLSFDMIRVQLYYRSPSKPFIAVDTLPPVVNKLCCQFSYYLQNFLEIVKTFANFKKFGETTTTFNFSLSKLTKKFGKY